MTITRRTAALTAGAFALLFSLTGCLVGGPAATQAPEVAPSSAAGSPTPTAEPVDPLTTVVELVARPDALELRADDGTVVAGLDYLSSPADAVTALTTVFGTPPVDEPYSGNFHHPDGVFHRWDQFVVDERFYDEARRAEEGESLSAPRFAVYFDGPAADGIVLSTASGLQAGVAWTDAESDPGFDLGLWTCTGTSVEAVASSPVPRGWTGSEYRANVVARPTDDGAIVQWITAPVMEAEGCA